MSLSAGKFSLSGRKIFIIIARETARHGTPCPPLCVQCGCAVDFKKCSVIV